MLEGVLSIERDAFLWLNGHHTPFWDCFMWVYSGRTVWIPVLALIFIMLFYKKKPVVSLLALVFLVLTLTACDQFASSICKPLFTRLRPTQHYPDFGNVVQTVYGYRGGLYGFISSHASNAFGFAVFTMLLFRDRRYSMTILIWAVLMCYSRIYLGVHFISDIVPGIFAGALFGFIGYRLFSLTRKLLLERVGGLAVGMFPPAHNWIIVSGILITIAFILIYSYIVAIMYHAEPAI